MVADAGPPEQRASERARRWMEEEHVSAVAFAVLEDGEILCEGLHGLANRETGTPPRADTLFSIASVTKALTAMAVLLSRDLGLLDLDTGIGAYLPSLPNPTWRPVTVRQLLSMSGGLPSVDGGPADPRLLSLLRQLARPGAPIPWNQGEIPWYELLALLAGYDVSSPGSPHPFLYSNPAYLLLGWIVQAVSPQRDYALFLHERLLWPLGMRDTHMKTVPLQEPAAIPYEHNPATGTYQRAPVRLPSRSWSAGGLVSSLRDLAILERALCHREILSPLSYREMWAPSVPGAPRGHYGLGWEILPGPSGPSGPRVLSVGALPGVSAGILRHVEQGLTVVLLANGSTRDLAPILGDLAQPFA